MGMDCTTLRFSLRKGGHKEHIKWVIMRKGPVAWSNLYGYGIMGMVDAINARD